MIGWWWREKNKEKRECVSVCERERVEGERERGGEK